MEDSIRERQSSTSSRTRPSLRSTIVIGLLGAYANIVAYGFGYGTDNHEFQLPLVNWLLNPGLYPNDLITQAFAHFPTIFWHVVAYLSHWLPIKAVVFLFFLFTKLLFFVALARLLVSPIKDKRFVICIVLAIAISPFLNDLTPLGASNVLDAVQTHTSLAIALALWAAAFLMEGRWILAAVVCAFIVYVDALFFVFMLFAFAAFALFDWHRRKAAILLSGLIGAAISFPWLLLSEGAIYRHYPNDYVEALLALYPFHLTLRSHEPYELISAIGLVVAAVLMVMIIRNKGCPRDTRFELLAASFFFPVLLGAIFGELHLTPTLARLQLLRADSFLLLFATLLIQIYAVRLSQVSTQYPAALFFLCSMAIVLPLSESLGLLWPLFIAMFLWFYSVEGFDAFSRAMVRAGRIRLILLAVLLAGIIFAGRYDQDWTSTVVILLVTVGSSVFVYRNSPSVSAARIGGSAIVVTVLSVIMVASGMIPKISRFWDPRISPTPLQSDWFDAQAWAKAHTAMDTQFLVPTFPGGFREFSERSSWGEWKDGQGMYHYPPLSTIYRERMTAVGYSWGAWQGTTHVADGYKRASWDALVALARKNHLSYIIQFRDVVYPATPVFSNTHYAIYEVR